MLLATWLWLAAGPPEHPEPPRARVEWRAPEACADEPEFLARVEELGEGQLSASFEFVVEGEGPFTLHVGGEPAQLRADRCEALEDAALLIVALAITNDPQAQAPRPPRAPSAADLRREALDVAPFLDDPERSSGQPRWGRRPTPGRLFATLGLSSFVTPRPALELSVGGGPRGRLWAVDLGAIARPIFGGEPLGPLGAARLSTWGGFVRTCVGSLGRRISLHGCVGGEVAAASARATGEGVEGRTRRQPWVAVHVGPTLGVPLGSRVALGFGLDLSWLAGQPQFDIAEVGRVCCRQPLGISARFGVELGLGR